MSRAGRRWAARTARPLCSRRDRARRQKGLFAANEKPSRLATGGFCGFAGKPDRDGPLSRYPLEPKILLAHRPPRGQGHVVEDRRRGGLLVAGVLGGVDVIVAGGQAVEAVV